MDDTNCAHCDSVIATSTNSLGYVAWSQSRLSSRFRVIRPILRTT